MLFYNLFVSSLLEVVQVAVGWMEWAGEMYCPRQMCCWKLLLLLCLTSHLSLYLSFSLALLSDSVQSPFSLLLFFIYLPGPLLFHFFSSFNLSLLPSCSSFPLQGGRHITAVGGRRACHVLLCLGLYQNIPPQVTLATAFPFDHPTVVWRKWQHSSFGRYSPVTPQKVTLTFNFSPLGMIHDLHSYVGQLMFIFDFWKS